MHRSIQRQFEWQRGFGNLPRLYRSILLYGSGHCAEHFSNTAGIAPADFVRVGFALYALALSGPVFDARVDLSLLGISAEMQDAALARLSIGLTGARDGAVRRRRGKRPTAYRASLLRDYPIIGYGVGSHHMTAPLPPLILQRITSGMYLDVVDGGEAVRREIGQRFEEYCLEYLRRSLIGYDVRGEVEYGTKKHRFRSPDVIVTRGGEVHGIFECKLKRMTLEARYSDDPIRDARSGYEEIAKDFVQIWRFLAHVRQGRTEGRVRDECSLAVVTHDPWLAMAPTLRERVLAIAGEMAATEPDVTDADRRPVAIVQIDEVEYSLQSGPQSAFMENIRRIADGGNRGWLLSALHERDGEEREYPFRKDLGGLLPWWDLLPDEGRSDERPVAGEQTAA